MVRTQIQLTEEQARKLRRAAREQGVSMAEIVRRCIDRGIDAEMPDRAGWYRRAEGLVGAFMDREGASDVSEQHDLHLGDSFG